MFTATFTIRADLSPELKKIILPNFLTATVPTLGK